MTVEFRPDKWNLNWLDPDHGKKDLECLISLGAQVGVGIHTSGSKALDEDMIFGDFIFSGVIYSGEEPKHKHDDKYQFLIPLTMGFFATILI